jgi:HAD superfamily hydrolase (TIGR01509 family)
VLISQDGSYPSVGQGAHTGSLAIVVDCDGTLVDTEGHWAIAERRVTELLGGTWSLELKRRLAGRSLIKAAVEVARWTSTPVGRANEIAAALGKSYRSVLLEEPVRAKPGAAKLLSDLLSRCIPVAVASNGRAEEVRTALRKAELLDRVHSVHTPSRNTRPKPAPDVYLSACRQLRAETRRAIAIEDTQTGLDAARAADLTTIGIPSFPGEPLEAQIVLDSLEEVDIALLIQIASTPTLAARDTR